MTTQPQSLALRPSSSQEEMPHLILSAHGGRILDANEAGAQLTGYSIEELATLRMGDLLRRRQYPEVMAFLEQSLIAGGGELEGVPLWCKNGVPRSVTFTIEIDDRGGASSKEHTSVAVGPASPVPLLRCSLRDVTERERMGQELRERNQALSGLHSLADTVTQVPRLEQVLADALNQILLMLNLDRGAVYVAERRDEEGPFILVASRGLPDELVETGLRLSSEDRLWRQTVGARRGDDRGDPRNATLVRERLTPSSELLPHHWRDAGVCALMSMPLRSRHRLCGLLLVGASQPHQFSSRASDLLELASHQLGMAVDNGLLFNELTDRIRDLSAMREFSSSILRNMREGLLTADAQGGITTLNPAAEEILQCSSHRAAGRDLGDVLGEDSELVGMIRSAMTEGTSGTRGEVVVRRGDGRLVPVGASVALLRAGADGHEPMQDSDATELAGAVLVFTDLTEQKKAEDQRRHQDRLALLGEMTAVLAHEVRNPLAGVVHGVQYLVEEASLGGEATEYARLILEDSRRISRLLDDVLMISRPQHVELLPCDMTGILEGILGHWRARAAARGVEVQTCYAADAPSPMGDPSRLQQVFTNLISNALEAMPGGGTLWLRVKTVELSSSLPGGDSCPAACVEVEDTGVGISNHALERIFEPFFTTREKGTGLGLAIAQRIVRDHQGKIEVSSEEGKGTCFTVVLPVLGETPGSELSAG